MKNSIPEYIYFDNASTTPLDHNVKKIMYECIENNFGNPSSIHYFGRQSRALIENCRKAIAKQLNASVGEIFFTSSATEATNIILKSNVIHGNIQKIITSQIEHPSVLNCISYLISNHNIEIVFLPIDEFGLPDTGYLQNELVNHGGDNTLVSLMHVNNEIGSKVDIQEIGEMCFKHNALFFSDTVQSIGKYKVDVENVNISFLVASAHKFHGPKGVGFFYMNKNNIIPPFIHGGSQERNMRAGTENIYGIMGMSLALEIANQNLDIIEDKILILKTHFMNQLLKLSKDVFINGNLIPDKSAFHILNVSFPKNIDTEMIMFKLDIAGICASSGSACSSGIAKKSHVLTAIGESEERVSVRFSFSKLNTLEEVDKVIKVLKSCISDSSK